MQFKNLVFLSKTDTAIGFVSQDAKRLNKIKQRCTNKPLITTLTSLNEISSRIPQAHKNIVRRANKTTFILPNKSSFRVSANKTHNILLKKIGWAYSTSANLTGDIYDEEFAINNSDVVIYPLGSDEQPSKLIRVGKTKLKRLR